MHCSVAIATEQWESGKSLGVGLAGMASKLAVSAGKLVVQILTQTDSAKLWVIAQLPLLKAHSGLNSATQNFNWGIGIPDRGKWGNGQLCSVQLLGT